MFIASTIILFSINLYFAQVNKGFREEKVKRCFFFKHLMTTHPKLGVREE